MWKQAQLKSKSHCGSVFRFLKLFLHIGSVGAFLSADASITLGKSLSLGSSSAATTETITVVVIGGGWAGFSAAEATSVLGENVQVHLLDASPRGPGGLAGGWRTPKLNRSVEAGIHGFWREYRNTFAVIERIGLKLDDVLTTFTPSALVSCDGKVAVAPVLGVEGTGEPSSGSPPLLSSLLPLVPFPDKFMAELAHFLPPPLDLAILAEFNEDSRLTLLDRVTGLGLLVPWLDFGQEDPESWLRYDKISAENLFRQIAGLSPTLYRELVTPLLHVLPMCPGWDCSAAAALSCFHVFALQSRGAFDVRWCRGSITEKIFNPWVQHLQKGGKVHIRGKSKVTGVEEVLSKGSRPYLVTINNDSNDQIACDAIILAVGATTAGRLIDACPPLKVIEGLSRNWKQLRGITCVAVRVFVDTATSKRLTESMAESPVLVCGPRIGNIPSLSETGFCIYDLGRLQDEYRVHVDGVGAFEVDFFRAGDLAGKPDDDILKIALDALTAALDHHIEREQLKVLDSSVFRAKDAVSHFCMGSAALSPPVRLKEKGIYASGDWVDRTGHASWSTEKAVVTGRQAAKALGKDFGLTSYRDIDIIPAARDTSQLRTLRQIASLARKVLVAGDYISPGTNPSMALRRRSGIR
ncbi:hypothetical protein ACA910_015099 [Epithemia clementina (nom. ined.)]